jgi:hypothetical protein
MDRSSERMRAVGRKADAAAERLYAARARGDDEAEWAAFVIVAECFKETVALLLGD